jgi:hypothetical protein
MRKSQVRSWLLDRRELLTLNKKFKVHKKHCHGKAAGFPLVTVGLFVCLVVVVYKGAADIKQLL